LAEPFWTRLPARRLQFTLDLLVLSSAYFLAYLLRFEFRIPASEWDDLGVQIPLVVLIQYAALSWAGVYAFIWRYIGLREVPAFLWAALISCAPLVLLRYGLPGSLAEWKPPISVIAMDAMLAFGGVLGLRIMRRILYERYEKRLSSELREEKDKVTLLIGAGRAGVIAAKEILGRSDTGMDVRGFVDDSPEKKGAIIHGLRVLGTTADLPALVESMGIEQVVITIAKASRKDMDRIVKTCESIPVKARIIPGLDQILGGKVEINRIRDVQIEDLLARDQVELDTGALAELITGQVVMVTGAGGSIGSELCRQIVRFAPKKLLLIERSEPALYAIDMELQTEHAGVPIAGLLADVCDHGRIQSIFEAHRPDLVLHAAAHKHVPLMEDNPLEAIKNNVLGTKLVGELSGRFGVKAFVFISTDKAVRPTSIMGASKRVAELVVQGLDRRFDTRYVAVRFGNVLGSNGSVIPRFREQIMKGGPVTVTHPEMVRYFMTIPEAAQLVLEAGAMGEGGEIFVLDMGEPVKILDLARRMITLLRPGDEIPIVFSGMRKGEKLYEELMADEESTTRTPHPKISIGRIAPMAPEAIDRALADLDLRIQWNDADGLRIFLSELIPESRLELPVREETRSGPVRLELAPPVT
jgi:FlaA1/EpsC-like NDP-sugar epimerase